MHPLSLLTALNRHGLMSPKLRQVFTTVLAETSLKGVAFTHKETGHEVYVMFLIESKKAVRRSVEEFGPVRAYLVDLGDIPINHIKGFAGDLVEGLLVRVTTKTLDSVPCIELTKDNFDERFSTIQSFLRG